MKNLKSILVTLVVGLFLTSFSLAEDCLDPSTDLLGLGIKPPTHYAGGIVPLPDGAINKYLIYVRTTTSEETIVYESADPVCYLPFDAPTTFSAQVATQLSGGATSAISKLKTFTYVDVEPEEPVVIPTPTPVPAPVIPVPEQTVIQVLIPAGKTVYVSVSEEDTE